MEIRYLYRVVCGDCGKEFFNECKCPARHSSSNVGEAAGGKGKAAHRPHPPPSR